MTDDSWVKTEGNIAIIGIKEESAKKVKEFIFIELPQKGDKIEKGQKYVTLEAMKWSGHLECPVSGEVIAINEELLDDPAKINQDPKNTWLVKIRTK